MNPGVISALIASVCFLYAAAMEENSGQRNRCAVMLAFSIALGVVAFIS